MSWTLLQNTLIVAGGSAALASLWGMAVAFFAATFRREVRPLAPIIAAIAFALPPFLTANLWLHYFGLAGVLRPYFPFELFSLGGTILLISIQLWPIAFFLTFSRLMRVDRAYFEFDPVLSGQPFITYVIWPAMRTAFWQAFFISFVLALNNFSIPALLQTKVYAAEVWLSFNTQFNYWEALLLSWPLILGPLLLLWVLRRKETRLLFRTQDFPARLFREKLGSLLYPSGVIAAKLVLVAVLLPLADLLFSARTWAELPPAVAAGSAATANSLLFALGSSLLVMTVALLVRERAWPLSFWIAFLTPGVLCGIAFIWLFNRPISSFFYGSAALVLLAYTVRFLAPGWSGARLAAESADQAPVDVVRSFGGSRWTQFRLAEWPQSKGMLLGTSLLIYLMALWEVETLILIVPPGRETLALRIFNMLHYGHAGQVNALCLWLLFLAAVPVLLFLLVRRIPRLLPSFSLFLFLLGCARPGADTAINSELFSSVEVIGSRGTGAGQFNKPRSVAVDREDNLYVVDLTGRVQKFDPNGKFLLSWQMPQTDKGKPKGMVQDPDGNVVVIEPHYSRVNHFDGKGHLVSQWGQHGTNAGQVTFPRSAAFNSRGEIYLSEYGMTERVLRFTTHGEKFLNVIGRPGIELGEFNRAEGLGIGPGDHLYVADSCNHRVQVFSREGKLIEAFGHAGSAPGQMSYPYDVRIDPSGMIFVCEFGNSRVQIFDPGKNPVGTLGTPGGEPGEMFNPWAIALDSKGNLYVADSGNHRVQKFSRRKPLSSPGPSKGTVANAKS